MNKFCAPLFIILLWVTSVHSQVKIDFTSGNVSASGQTIDVDVVVSDFTDIVSMQFSLNWDPTIFSYSSVENVTTVLPQFTEDTNFGTPPTAQAVNDGQLTVSWSLSSTNPASVPDGTRLFTLRLTSNGDLCDRTTVALSNTPRTTEVVDNDLTSIGFTATGGAIAIDDGSCGMMGMDGIGLYIDDITAPKGGKICIPITATDFQDVESFSMGLRWNPAILSIDTEVSSSGIKEAGLTMLNANTQEINQGRMRILWLIDNQAANVADNGTLFEVCFNVVGETGGTSALEITDFPNATPPFRIEITGNGQTYDYFTDNGTFTVGSGGEPERIGVGFIADDLYTEGADNICVPIKTENFDSIVAFTTGISFDPAILSYSAFNQITLTGIQVADQNKQNGELRVLWTDQNANANTLEDGTTLLEICFDVIGNDGDRSEFGFINIPPNFAIEAIKFPARSTDFFIDDGSVTIGNAPIPPDSLTLTVSTELFDANDTVCIDFTVQKFTNIAGMSFVVSWDESILTYVGPRNLNLEGLSTGSSNFNFIAPDAVRVLHTPPAAQTVADGTSIFQLCYVAIPACDSEASTDITIGSDANVALEFIDDADQLVPLKIVNGRASARSCTRNSPSIDLVTLTRPSCPGNLDGAILVDVLNENGNFTCSWTNASGTVVTTNCSLAGVAAGVYTITIIDEADSTATRTFTVDDPAPVDTSAVTVISCDDGSGNAEISVAFTGGNAPYTLVSASSGTISGLSISGLTEGSVTFMVRDAEGCDYMFSYTVRACRPVDGPVTACDESRTIISPNGDNMNETFVIGCLNDPDVFSLINDLAIYNRWGERVYATDNYANDWTGTNSDGTELDEGGYMWVLTIGGPTDRKIFRGTVTILR